MAKPGDVIEHYSHGGLLDAIRDGLRELGKTPETATIDDLGPVDEFHIGGRQASVDFIGQLGLASDDHVLDVGCGLGGTARFIASTHGCKVSGIDLTPEYIETGQTLCEWVGLTDRVALYQGDARTLPFADAHFDGATMLHVGMNVADKTGAFAEVNRVLRPGALFGVFDIMRTGDEPLMYPVPWATRPDTSTLATPTEYRDALERARFQIIAERNRRDFATEFFATLRKRMEGAGGPPPLGLHILFGETAPIKIRNMVDNIAANRAAPVEMIARKID